MFKQILHLRSWQRIFRLEPSIDVNRRIQYFYVPRSMLAEASLHRVVYLKACG